MIALVWLLLVVTRPVLWAAETPPPVTLNSDTLLSNEGYFVLDWSAPSNVSGLSLQQETTALDETLTVRAAQLPASGAITITGLPNGEYTYRLLANNQIVSNPITITVQHHALSRAFRYFLLGLTLFSVLVGTILTGRARAHRLEHAGSSESTDHPTAIRNNHAR